jgi:hypothetical protein
MNSDQPAKALSQPPGLASNDSVQKTIKQHFLRLAQILEKGNPIPIEMDYNDNLNFIKCLMPTMPTGQAMFLIRRVIQGYFSTFPKTMESSGLGNWKEIKAMSGDKKKFWVILYRFGAYPSDEEACKHVLSDSTATKPLQYTDDELKAEI